MKPAKTSLPHWMTAWLSWSTLGASCTLGLGLLLMAGELALRGGEVRPACAYWFGGLGFIAIAALVRRFGPFSGA